ncbi:hypothetical protein SteCoe_25189 [Stentor coeruleus]|uniref:Rhodanese domain-containing protein n=1 Tax=Stentor coeruleus TaxID=5963 RepID=A0A1R2BFS5_9CILI|nr:hypothetical protein SteCoe_25189 [Stentor coeruleus]
MCIINIEDLSSFQNKTLIFFSSGPYFGKLLPNSYTIEYSDLSILIRDLRRLDISDFPVICYDNEDLKIASLAYWIFESLDYLVKILYGDMNIFSLKGQNLVTTSKHDLPQSNILMDIDITKLPKVKIYNSLAYELIFPLYITIGTDLTSKLVKKYLKQNNIPEDLDGCLLCGPFSAVVGALLKYLGNYQNKIFLGEWKDLGFKSKNSSKPGTFYSAAESVYYDAFYSAAESVYYDAVETISDAEVVSQGKGKKNIEEDPQNNIGKECPNSEAEKETETPVLYNSFLKHTKSITEEPKNPIPEESQGYHCLCQII